MKQAGTWKAFTEGTEGLCAIHHAWRSGQYTGQHRSLFHRKGSEVNSLQLRLDGIETSISGVQTGQDGQAFDIYSLNGIKVRSQAATTDGLPKGIYLINGKTYSKIRKRTNNMKKLYTTPVTNVMKWKSHWEHLTKFQPFGHGRLQQRGNAR